MEALVVPVGGGKDVLAVGIETIRAPFVVRSAAKDDTLEVPWHDREAGKIRSASRFDNRDLTRWSAYRVSAAVMIAASPLQVMTLSGSSYLWIVAVSSSQRDLS